MLWNNFFVALPADFQDILIVYMSKEKKFYTCKSEDYKKIVGENKMDMRYAFWTVIETKDIKIKE